MEKETIEILKQRVYFLERVVFEIVGGTIGKHKIVGKKFDSLESLTVYISERWKEYEERYW